MDISDSSMRRTRRSTWFRLVESGHEFCARARYERRWSATLSLLLLCLLSGLSANAQSTQKNVLFLFSAIQPGDQVFGEIESVIRAQIPGPVTFYRAYLDDPEIEQKSYRASVAETLRQRYGAVKMDAVIALQPAGIYFAREYREKIFPGAPIVFAGMGKGEVDGQKMGPGITGVATPVGFRETIDLALRLQPDTKAIAIIAGVTNWDRSALGALHAQLVRYQDRVKEIDVIGAPNQQLVARIAALPPHTVAMFQVYPQYSDQPQFGTWELLTETARRLPTYTPFKGFCINGCVGGVYQDELKLWTMTGNLAVQVLSGKRVDDIPIEVNWGSRPQVDWRALQRWHIPESVVPGSALVVNRKPTLWEQGRRYFLAAIAVIVVQSLLIFGLFWHRARRRRAESELERSEQKFSKAFRRSPLAITIVRARDGRYLDVNEAFELQTGWKRDEVVGHSAQELSLWANHDQRTSFLKQLVAETSVRDMEIPLRRRDGEIRTTLGSAELIDIQGEPCALSVFADVTERKQAEEAMTGFGRKLIEAQETERTRIARELHDDINQRLAMVAVSLRSAKKGLPSSETKISRILDDAGERVSELGDDIQALSHRLHSSKLEYLGLEAATSGFCRELSEGQNVSIHLECENVPRELSSEVSLCLFRVLQEALRNATKYSGVSEFAVSLIGTRNGIELRVHDSGAGFDPSPTNKGHGLGLTSMKERLRMVRGELSIDSRPGQGTTVVARVPLPATLEEHVAQEEKSPDFSDQATRTSA